MEFSTEQKQIIDTVINTNNNILVLWVAWAWKSAVIEEVQKQSWWKILLLWTTWIAAVNIWWNTIHSALRIGIHNEIRHLDPSDEWVLRKVKKIIIDEGSMLRPDLLDAINLRLQKTHNNDSLFGWVQIILFWDLYQLPPIVNNSDTKFFNKYKTPFFFSSKNYINGNFKFFELIKVFRQDNKDFIDMLARIRVWKTTDEDLVKLNQRWIKNLDSIDENVILISTVNSIADRKNQIELDKLQTEQKTFIWRVKWKYPKALYPVNDVITLKIGSRVMTTINKIDFKNWSLWVVTQFWMWWVYITLDNWNIAFIESHKFQLKEQDEVIWEYEQIPLKLASAISIHKSQWQTFEKVIIDIWRWTFVWWQFYVAISRWIKLENIYFIQEIKRKDIFANNDVKAFLSTKAE